MGTTASITAKLADDEYRSIFVGGDGYPSHTGLMLVNHYNTPEKIEALIRMGDCKFLGETLEACPKTTNNFGSAKYSTFYIRDYKHSVSKNQSRYNETAKFAVNAIEQPSFEYYWNGTEWMYKNIPLAEFLGK